MTDKSYNLDTEQIARFAKAMGHPARITILNYLASLDCCYFGDIHNELPIAKATVSQHLKELKDAGLIQGEIEMPKVKYCINRENWEKARAYFSLFFEQKETKKSCCN
jgi:ArsR family transcriptional regulator, arsenate/arsenite/antimonite-responsive transcriptional repressor